MKYSINSIASKLTSSVIKRQQKKFDKLMMEKRIEARTRENPNKMIWNLSTRTSSDGEVVAVWPQAWFSCPTCRKSERKLERKLK